MLSYCPQCGKEGLQFQQDKLWTCRYCSFHMYFNVATATAGILMYQGKLVALKRNRQPGKGLLDLPGGFADPGERAEEAMRREMKEELGVLSSELHYLTSFPNQYLYKGLNYATCDLFFWGVLEQKPRLCDPEENSQIHLLDWNEVDLGRFAFSSIQRGLEFYMENR